MSNSIFASYTLLLQRQGHNKENRSSGDKKDEWDDNKEDVLGSRGDKEVEWYGNKENDGVTTSKAERARHR